MSFCTNCGKEVKETDEFCQYCGKPIKAAVGATETQVKISRQYATLAERFLAALIDIILLAVVAGVIMIPFGIVTFIGAQLGTPIGWFFGAPQLLMFILWIVYFTYFESTSGQTIGKRLLSIKVMTDTGRQVNTGDALIRNILRIIDWLPFIYIVGLILIETSAKKQRLGDLAAKTIVVKV